MSTIVPPSSTSTAPAKAEVTAQTTTAGPVLTAGQDRVAQFIVTHGRRQHVRTPGAYLAFANAGFALAQSSLPHDLPQTHYLHCDLEMQGSAKETSQ
jgi:hypothetical protein